MDDRRRRRAACCEGVDMGHYIMAQFPFLFRGHVIIDIIQMKAHFLQLRIRDGDAKLLLTFRQSQPQSAPCGELPVVRKDLLHLFSGIAGAERIHVGFVHFILPRTQEWGCAYAHFSHGSGA